MKAFRFTLKAVQNLRPEREQKGMETYVHALLARQQILDRLETGRERIRRTRAEIHRRFNTDCAISRLARFNRHKRALEKQQAARIVALALAERRVQAVFQAMVTACRHRETVEHFRAERREEQKLLTALVSRLRKSRRGLESCRSRGIIKLLASH